MSGDYQDAKSVCVNDLECRVRPVALLADAMKDCTRRGDIVIDTFAGLGTTILAAERVGRHARAIEIEPRLVDIAIQRWQACTRKDAIHMPSGLRFKELADYRAEKAAATFETR